MHSPRFVCPPHVVFGLPPLASSFDQTTQVVELDTIKIDAHLAKRLDYVGLEPNEKDGRFEAIRGRLARGEDLYMPVMAANLWCSEQGFLGSATVKDGRHTLLELYFHSIRRVKVVVPRFQQSQFLAAFG